MDALATETLEDQIAPAVRSVSILGATGSIGESTLDLISCSPESFDVQVLTANHNVEKLARQARKHRARKAVIGDVGLYHDLKSALAGTGIEAAAGEQALIEAGGEPVDCVVAAIVGAAGLRPSLAAARQGRRVALANKESLVIAGNLYMREIKDAGTTLLPVDSEHSAALQALAGESKDHIERLVVTASGGPFRTWTKEQIAVATPEQALRHPNWSMGAKITIDSATLMNKGLELIEAFHLFDVKAEQLGAIVHPQSIIHCLVEFFDGSVIAQMANPDMRTPIAVSLAWPHRMPAPTQRLDLVKLGSLTFEEPDLERFPALRLAQDALKVGGAAPNVLNAANECAVSAFLEHRISFPTIVEIVEVSLERADNAGLLVEAGDVDHVLEVDRVARQLACELIRS